MKCLANIEMDIPIFTVGLLFGSFLNSLIYRLPRKISLFNPSRSFCPNCRHTLSWWENIPLFSFLLRKGRCRQCQSRIPLRYPFVELMGGVIAWLIYQCFGYGVEMIPSLILFWGLFAIGWIDAQNNIIPNKILLFLVVTGIISSIIFGYPDPISAVLGLLAGSGLLLIIERLGTWLAGKPAMGMGDLKLAGVLGFYLGWESFLVTLFLASALGVGWSILHRLLHLQGNPDRIPFAPFLGLGAFLPRSRLLPGMPFAPTSFQAPAWNAV